MKRFRFPNPLDGLLLEHFEKLRQLEECKNLDFLTAVEILGLNPKADFRHCNLDGISFDEMDLSEYDFSGSSTIGCSFKNTILPKDFFVAVNRCASSRQYGGSKFVSLAISKKLRSIIACDQIGNFFRFSAETLELIARKPLVQAKLDLGFITGTDRFFAINANGDLRILGGLHMSVEEVRKVEPSLSTGTRRISHGQLVETTDYDNVYVSSVLNQDDSVDLSEPDFKLISALSSVDRSTVVAISSVGIILIWRSGLAAVEVNPNSFTDQKLGHARFVHSISSNGRYAAISFNEHDVWIFDTKDQTFIKKTNEVTRVDRYQRMVTIEVLNDGGFVALISDETVRYWHPIGKGAVKRFDVPFRVECWCVDEDLVAFAGDSGNMLVTNLEAFVS